MKTRQKLIFIISMATMILSAIILPCTAYCATIGDYTDNPTFDPIADNSKSYQVELQDLTSFYFPMYEISTMIPYSDNDPGFTILNVRLKVVSFYGSYEVYLSSNQPYISQALYDEQNDPDHEDAFAEISLLTYNDPYNNGFYAFTLNWNNIWGYEEIDTDTTIYLTLSSNSLFPSTTPSDTYFDGYEQGYNDGFADGKIFGESLGDSVLKTPFETLRGIFVGIGTLFEIQLFPGISIGLLLSIPLVLLIVLFVLHIVRG